MRNECLLNHFGMYSHRSTKFAAKYPFGACPLEEGAQACKAFAMTS